jgi:predicted RNase H-like nuclease
VVAVGIDGCRTGWIAVAVNVREIEVFYLPTIDALSNVVEAPSAIAIDIPIGLPDAGRRPADVEARLFLGPRRQSVFFTPVRAAVEAASHATATALSRQLTGSGISRQAHNLAKKILEVERWLPTAPCAVWEVHPEVSFALMIGRPARAPKKTWAGMIERRLALAAAGIDLDGAPYEVGIHAAVDDVLDAAAVAWSAGRLLAGTARSFPQPPAMDGSGRPVAFWG